MIKEIIVHPKLTPCVCVDSWSSCNLCFDLFILYLLVRLLPVTTYHITAWLKLVSAHNIMRSKSSGILGLPSWSVHKLIKISMDDNNYYSLALAILLSMANTTYRTESESVEGYTYLPPTRVARLSAPIPFAYGIDLYLSISILHALYVIYVDHLVYLQHMTSVTVTFQFLLSV